MTFLVTHARRPLARKNTPMAVTGLSPDMFEGYASLFNVRDGAGDMVAPGAFAASLRRRGPSEVRLLYQHFAHAPIGTWDAIAEDSRGLHVRGRLACDIEQARDVRALLAWEVMPNHQGVTRPQDEQGTWHAAAEPFGHLALWGVKDLYALVEALAARVAALEAAHDAG